MYDDVLTGYDDVVTVCDGVLADYDDVLPGKVREMPANSEKLRKTPAFAGKVRKSPDVLTVTFNEIDHISTVLTRSR